MRTRILEITAALAIGLVIGLAGYAIWLSTTDDEPAPSTTTGATISSNGPQDPADLVAAYERSRTVSFALDGVFRRERNDQQLELLVRQARDGDRALDEVGSIAFVTTDGSLRRCELIDQTVLCTDPEAAPTVQQEVAAFESLVGGTDADYEVYLATTTDVRPLVDDGLPVDPSACWTLIALEAGALGQYGDEGVLCFDSATGVLVGRTTRIGTSTETFVAVSVRLEVESGDLEPSGA